MIRLGPNTPTYEKSDTMNVHHNTTEERLQESYDSHLASTPTASFPELPTAHGELYEMLHRWWDIQEELLVQLEESRIQFLDRSRKEALLDSIQKGQKKQYSLLWKLSPNARELLCVHRRVSIPGVVFDYEPAEPGEDIAFDQLVGRAALSLSVT